MALESGIILPVPQADPIVGEIRRRHDPQEPLGVPAHITLLYPFAHPSQVAQTLPALNQAFSRVPAFDFSLVEVRRFTAAAYLHPEPPELFVRLTEMLVRQWPEFPPYGGSFPTVIPHLTVADRATSDTLDTITAALATRLPIPCRATEAWLICSDDRGFWSRREVFRLNQPYSGT